MGYVYILYTLLSVEDDGSVETVTKAKYFDTMGYYYTYVTDADAGVPQDGALAQVTWAGAGKTYYLWTRN